MGKLGPAEARRIRFATLYSGLLQIGREHGNDVKVRGMDGMVTCGEAKRAVRRFAQQNGINLQGEKK